MIAQPPESRECNQTHGSSHHDENTVPAFTGSAASRNRFSTGGARHSLEQKGDGTASSIVVEAMMLLCHRP